MAKVKLTKKETTFIREEENEKDFLAYKNVQLYATTDIPLHKPEKTESKMFTPVTLWKDYDPKKEALETYFLSEEKGRKDYSFCALHKEDGNLYVQITVFPLPIRRKKPFF